MSSFSSRTSPAPICLAASLGSQEAIARLPKDKLAQLTDGLTLLLSCSELNGQNGLDFGDPTPWPYSLEAAQRCAVAAYRGATSQWDLCWQTDSHNIPSHIPRDYPQTLLSGLERWIVRPESFSQDELWRTYEWIKDEICLDGYLDIEFRATPRVIAGYCLGSLFLMDISSRQPDCWPSVSNYEPAAFHAASNMDAVASLLDCGVEELAIRDAIVAEVVPWCLGQNDAVAQRVNR